MKTRNKLLVSLLIFIAGLIANIYFSSALHLILSRQMRALKLLPIRECIASIVIVQQHTVLFLCFQGFVTLLSILYVIVNNKPYQSALRTITPQISTLVPTGQKQHGSAEWLTEKEKDISFSHAVINLNSRFIKNLIAKGYDDIREINRRKGTGKNHEKEEIGEQGGQTPIVYTDSAGSAKTKGVHEPEKPKPKLVHEYKRFQMKQNSEAINARENIGSRIRTVTKEIDNIVSVIAKTGSDALVKRLSMLEDEKAELEFKFQRICEDCRIPEVTSKQMSEAFKKARGLLCSGKLPTVKKLIELYVNKVIVYTTHVEVRFNFHPDLTLPQNDRLGNENSTTEVNQDFTFAPNGDVWGHCGGERSRRTPALEIEQV